jgi:O-antigen/teichoic acid export membrane protein
MTRDRLLARNTIVNLVGVVAPVVVAIVAIPFLVQGMGTTRFGILALAWSMIGYFSLFDLGLGRALTQAIATRLGGDSDEDLAAVSWTALAFMLLLGVLGGLLLAGVTPLLVHRVLNIPAQLHDESATAFYLLALALPATLATTGLRGILEAHQDFGIATALRLPLSVVNFLGPLAVLQFSNRLGPILAILVAARVLGAVLHFIVCRRRYGFLRLSIALRRDLIAPLVRTGGWMTVSNIISPLMVNGDRFVIGAVLSVAAVAYYVTPFEVVTKLWLVPSAVLGVLFPAFAATFARDPSRTATLVGRAVRMMIVMIFPFALVFVALGREGLTLWMGAAFARESTAVLQWLAVAVLINCVAYVPFTALQAIGRSDLTAKVHLAELPLYGVAIWLLARAFGLVGVAMAWTLRVAVDTTLLLVLTARPLTDLRRDLVRSMRILALLLVSLGVAATLSSTAARAFFAAVSLAVFLPMSWLWLLQPDERDSLRRYFGVGTIRSENATS